MLTPRFRGRTDHLFAIYACIKQAPPPGVHPGQIAREIGVDLRVVAETLDGMPELFLKIPRSRDRLTRYRLTPQINVKARDEVEVYLQRAATRETMILYALGAMGVCAFLIVIALIGPALETVSN